MWIDRATLRLGLILHMANNLNPLKALLNSRRILVVGDVMLDRYWFGDVDRISPEAPVPVLRITREQERLGGAANVALNVKTLGGNVTLLSVVGNDEPSNRLAKLLSDYGISAALAKDHRVQTIVKLRLISHSQQLMRVDFEKMPNHEILSKMLSDFEHQMPRHDVVLFSDYGKGCLAEISHMIEMARKFKKLVLVDPKGTDFLRYFGATVLKPNLAEMRQIVGAWQDEVELERKAEDLRSNLGLQALLLTRSEEGMSLFQADGVQHLKSQVREVADVTGAGDTVIATLALMLACGLSMIRSMEIANRAGGLVVSKFGTSTVTYEELFG